jgi:hypothetical protein
MPADAPADAAPDAEHPERSAEIVRRWSAPSAGVITAVLQHHEREDGHGYCRGLRGSAIVTHAKILGLVDTYARLTMSLSGRPGREPYHVVHEIRHLRREFAPALIKLLLDELSLFPPGTVVRLSTGEMGRVVAVRRGYPMRPRVELITDSHGDRYVERRTVDLATTRIYVAGVDEGGGRGQARPWFDPRDGFWKEGPGYWE